METKQYRLGVQKFVAAFGALCWPKQVLMVCCEISYKESQMSGSERQSPACRQVETYESDTLG